MIILSVLKFWYVLAQSCMHAANEIFSLIAWFDNVGPAAHYAKFREEMIHPAATKDKNIHYFVMYSTAPAKHQG